MGYSHSRLSVNLLRFVGLADISSQTESTIHKIVKSSSLFLTSYRRCSSRLLLRLCGLLESSVSFWTRFTVSPTTKEELSGSASLPSPLDSSLANTSTVRQVLLLNPAPLIGLSATVGAPERFSAWLASIEKTRGREYSLIQHHHRYVVSLSVQASH